MLYLFDNGECNSFMRNGDAIGVNYRDDMPESFYEDAEEGVLLVFDGVIHQDTQDATDEDLEARGLPTNAKHYSEWWEGSLRPATDAEILEVFSNAARAATGGEG